VPTVVAVLLVFLVLTIVVALAFAVGVGWIAVLPILVVAALAIWGALAFSRRSPRSVLAGARRPELLGPGGADDPDAGR
jgi:uncharacterized membrane protein YbjE (DUF340 family)